VKQRNWQGDYEETPIQSKMTKSPRQWTGAFTRISEVEISLRPALIRYAKRSVDKNPLTTQPHKQKSPIRRLQVYEDTSFQTHTLVE